MNYQEAVAEFRHLDDSIEAGQWRQAQITSEQLAHVTQREWADAVGKSQPHIYALNQVWRRWSDKPTYHRPSFADAYRMAENHAETPEEASAIKDANRASSALGKLPPKSRAQIIREHFTDSDVLDEVMNEPAVRGRAIEAIDRHQQRQDHIPPAEPAPDPFKLLHDFRKLHRAIEEIARQVSQRGAVVSHAERELLLEETTWLRNALSLIEDGIRGDTLDAALAKIFSESAG